MASYDNSFYARGAETALASAGQIVPLVMELVGPQSVVDVGCGTGEWLSQFRHAGASDVYGVDGPWVPRHLLKIPSCAFGIHQIGHAPLSLGRQFDLAVSLEVGEHLPAEEAAGFVADLVKLAPVVLFSAAIPHQGGVGHVNEQWPAYWTALFHQLGYCSIDCIRLEVWRNPEVAYWYAQNCFIAVRSTVLPMLSRLNERYHRLGGGVTALVHPLAYEVKARQVEQMRLRLGPRGE